MTEDERIDAIRSTYVGHERLENLIKLAESYMALARRYHEVPCLSIVGNAGVGKSTVALRLLNKYPPIETKDGANIPVLHLTIPSNATHHTMAQALLESLGDPRWQSGSTADKTQRALGLLRDCEVQLIICDEFHHLYDNNKERILKNEANWIKTLIIKSKISMVIMGGETSIEIIKVNEHLDRRVNRRRVLERFQNDSEFEKVLYALERELPLDEQSLLWTPGMVDRIYEATDGIPARVFDLVKSAAITAVEQGLPKVDRATLASAYVDCLRHLRSADRPNPFE